MAYRADCRADCRGGDCGHVVMWSSCVQATVIMYLTDVQEGGETAFPWLGGAGESPRTL